MFRLISWLIYMMTNQQKRESSEYLWMVYEKVKIFSRKNGSRIYMVCIGFFGKTERIFRSKRNLPTIRFFRMDRVGYLFHKGQKWKKLRDFFNR